MIKITDMGLSIRDTDSQSQYSLEEIMSIMTSCKDGVLMVMQNILIV